MSTNKASPLHSSKLQQIYNETEHKIQEFLNREALFVPTQSCEHVHLPLKYIGEFETMGNYVRCSAYLNSRLDEQSIEIGMLRTSQVIAPSLIRVNQPRQRPNFYFSVHTETSFYVCTDTKSLTSFTVSRGF